MSISSLRQQEKGASLHGGRLAHLNYNRGLKPLPLTSQHWPNGRWYKSSSPVSSCKQNYLFIDSFSVPFSGAQSDCNSESPINCKNKIKNKDINSCSQKCAFQLEPGNLMLCVFRGPSESRLRTGIKKQTKEKRKKQERSHELLLWNKNKIGLTSWKSASRPKQNLMYLLLFSILFSFC